jgi:hypothetical protein
MEKLDMQKSIIKSGFIVAMCFIMIEMYGQSDKAKSLPQFLFPQFSKGILKMKDGRALTATLNYNMLDENMVFEQNGVYMIIDKPGDIDTVSLNNSRFVYFDKVFYDVVCKGNVAIFIEHKCRLSPAGSATAYGMTSKTLGPTAVWSMQSGNQFRNLDLPSDVAVSDATVYWVKTDGKMTKFQNEKQFTKIFPGSEEMIKDFIKKSGINIKTADGLAKLGAFCNGLQK